MYATIVEGAPFPYIRRIYLGCCTEHDNGCVHNDGVFTCIILCGSIMHFFIYFC